MEKIQISKMHLLGAFNIVSYILLIGTDHDDLSAYWRVNDLT